MKMLSFVLVCMALAGYSAAVEFRFAEIKEKTSLTIPADADKENSVGGSVGARLVFGGTSWSVDARNYLTLPKTKWSVLSGVTSFGEAADIFGGFRYGLGATLFSPALPVTVRGGMLSFSKSVSRLKNPTPSSTANPLTKSFGFSAGIGANLPTLSSAEKPLALFASVSVPKTRTVVPLTAQVAFDEEQTMLASVSYAARPRKFLSLQGAVTAGRFWVSADNTTGTLLADTNAEFSAQWLYAASIEGALSSPFVKAKVFAGLHQMPFDAPYSPCAVWIQAALRTTWRNMLVDLTYFCIPTLGDAPKPVPLAIAGTSSTSVCRTIAQAGVHPQVQFELNNVSAATLRVGVSVLGEKKILATREAEQYSTLKWGAGIAYESKPFTAKATMGATNVLLDGSFLTASTTPDRSYSADLSASLAVENVKASVSLGYDRYPTSVKTGNSKDAFSLDVSASPGKARLLTLTGGTSVSYKNGKKTSSSADASAQIKLNRRWIRTTITCAVSVPL